ncbi:MAG: response regulator transcription factor [Desulfobacter sp.]|nr:MAG: response regulator transcription factor [Desulfobacter sp.]
MNRKKKILIIDDHPLFREGIKSMIQNDGRYEVVAEAGTARQGLNIAKTTDIDLAVVDISLPDQNGFELIKAISEHSAGLRIIVVSMHSQVDYIVKAFQAGALGYLTKESASDRLMGGIETTLKGEYFMDSSVSQQVIHKLARPAKKKPAAILQGYDALTSREQEVMGLVANGMSSKKIAKQLYISPKTVENHRSNIMRKLQLKNVIDLARYATKLGLVDVELWKK